MAMDQIIRHLKNCDSALVTAHVNPDGDAVGSLIALGLALKALNKKTTLYNESAIPAVYRFLPEIHRIVRELNPRDAHDVAVVLDCGSLDRVGDAAPAIGDTPVLINMDHHATNTRFGDVCLVDPAACATAEIVYRVVKALGVVIDPDIAASIYTGILTDTGSFRFSNTNLASFSICNEMIAVGVEPYAVARHVYGTYSLGRIKLLNLALDSIEISGNGKLSIMTLSQEMLAETGTQKEDIDGLIHYARRIEDIKVAALIQEMEKDDGISGEQHTYHVSLRSDGEVDVAVIAAAFGGGGHPTAAGFNIDASLPDLKSRITGLVENL
jgi:phosphoesterase RecJ-like protein